MVNKVLAPYVATAPDHVVPILILDMYPCHMEALAVQMIQEFGGEVKHIPGDALPSASPWMLDLISHSRIRCDGSGLTG